MPDTRENRYLAQRAFEPIRVDTGTYYPCREEDLADYRHFPGPNRQRLVPMIEAANEIVHRNTELRRREDFDRDEWAAMERLTSGVNKAAWSGYTPDIIIKMFADLDLVFFNGRLLGNVLIKWHVVGPRIFGDTGPHRTNQAGIRLNPDEIFIRSDNAFQRMFSTMLHEMCHAYKFIRCSRETWGHGDGHDVNFRTMIHAVHRRAFDCLGIYAIGRENEYFYHHHMSHHWEHERGGGPSRSRYDGDPIPTIFRGDTIERTRVGEIVGLRDPDPDDDLCDMMGRVGLGGSSGRSGSHGGEYGAVMEVDTAVMEVDPAVMEVGPAVMEVDPAVMEVGTAVMEVDTAVMEVEAGLVPLRRVDTEVEGWLVTRLTAVTEVEAGLVPLHTAVMDFQAAMVPQTITRITERTILEGQLD